MRCQLHSRVVSLTTGGTTITVFLVDISRLVAFVEDARRKMSNTDATNLFVDNPAVGDYFHNISAAAGFSKSL